MQHNLREFLRHGGSGQYVFARQNGAVCGYRAGVSIKSTFPDYADLRANFTDRLDRVIADNTRMLLNALTPPDTVPWVTEAGLRDVSDAKEEALRQWDARLIAIFEEYETQPQRLRPLQAAMEERLLRAFAGLINQLRQQDLGIERYIWRSQDDAKVRDSHAQYDDQVFRWDEPPAGGRPRQAHSCRCYAEPIEPASRNDITLIEYVPTQGGYPLSETHRTRGGGGHTIERHVGKSEAFLIGMVSVPVARTLFQTVYRGYHGSFSSLAAAERLTNANLSRNAAIVNAVATGQQEDAILESTFSSITGLEAYRLTRGTSSPIRLRPTYSVRTYIRHAPEMPNGFVIVTSFPRNE